MVMFLEELEAMGEVEAPALTELDMEMEAAEQLIQLSGCDGDDGGGESESRSADSVKYCKAAAGKEKDKDVAVESCRKMDERFGAEKGNADDEVVIGGDARRRPRFRSLAAIYKETRRLSDGRRGADQEGERKNNPKRARDGAADEALPWRSATKEERQSHRTSLEAWI